MSVSEDRLWHLMARQQDGSITGEELKELEHLLEAQPGIRMKGPFVKKVLSKGVRFEQRPVDQRSQWESIEAGIRETTWHRRKWKKKRVSRWTIAASTLVVAATGLWIFSHFSGGYGRRGHFFRYDNVVTTQPASRSSLILPDGTKVWLNSGSKLSYNDFNSSPERRINLSGEAYFEVVHDSLRPFVVHTAAADIRDIGTTFLVRAYPNETKFEAVLVEGSIEVTKAGNMDRKILLKPDEKIVIPLSGSVNVPTSQQTQSDNALLYKINRIKKDAHGLIPETAWIDNKLVFDNESFGQLAKRMERWYNVKMHFKDSTIINTPFSGIIEKETLEQALQAMQFSSSFTYRIQGDEVYIGKSNNL
ncbi:MAG TPA: FecR domain-containing protein [Chitinophagaceae bacterium]|nr:FecR domain-containing protein [Chitinophagaceae bacterium]